MLVSVRAQDLTVTDDPVPSGTYEAAGTVSASSATVPDGHDVTFRAGQRVMLGAGFGVERGAQFVAETEASSGGGQVDFPITLEQMPPAVSLRGRQRPSEDPLPYHAAR